MNQSLTSVWLPRPSLLGIGHHLSSLLGQMSPSQSVTLLLHLLECMKNIEREQVPTRKITLEKPKEGSLQSLVIALIMKFRAGTAILDLSSPEKPTTVVERPEKPTTVVESQYEEYFTIEGQRAKFKKVVEPRTNVFDRLGPAQMEEDEILAEVLEADRRAEEELQARIKQMENDRREQERKQWEEEARIREQQRAKREAERAKKSEVFRDTSEYEQAKESMTRRTILKDPMPPGFSKLPTKEAEPESARKRVHRSSGKSGGQFMKPAGKVNASGLLRPPQILIQSAVFRT